MTQLKFITIGAVELELCFQETSFLGIGQIRIKGKVVRSGELPLRPFTATHDGIEFDQFLLDSIEEQGENGVVLHTRTLGTSAHVAALQDHSLDPVWSDRAWDGRLVAEARMDWHFQAETRVISGRQWHGFSYAFSFHGDGQEIYYLLDRASWELDGDPVGVTLLRQQMGGDPMVTFEPDTSYSTSAVIPFPLSPIMTYDVPRWASEQGFDYQYHDGLALIGLFASCGLIRSVVVRRAGEGHIRHLDKHIFDQTAEARTIAKFIGLAEVGDLTDQLNAWTQVFDTDQDNVLGEFGMQRTYPRTTLSHNFWNNFTAESYLDDLIPAAAALGFQQVFIDPYWQNDMTRAREGKLPEQLGGNMCCPHEYEVADVLGGIPGYRKVADEARALGVELISWIGSHQSQNSPYLHKHRVQVIKGPDARHFYGSGYDSIYGMDIASPFGVMFRDAAIAGCQQTTVNGYLYDSFYNFAWMPINFHTPDPQDPTNSHAGALRAHTMWRQLAEIMAAWQKAGMHMLIESLGPWGQPQHGVQGNYRLAGGALAYQCAVNIGYSVIPTPGTSNGKEEVGPDFYFRLLANKAPSTLNLWVKDAQGERLRIDRAASPILRMVNLAYRAVLPRMHTRTILHQDAGVSWQDRDGRQSALYSYVDGHYPLADGTRYRDLTSGVEGVSSNGLQTAAWHVYEIL